MAMADNRGDERSQSERDYARSLGQNIREQVHAGIASGLLTRRRRPPAAGIIFAVLIIAAGVLLFLDNLGVYHIYNIWRLWPVVLIVAGVSKMFESQGAGGRVWAGMVLSAGVILLLDNLGIWHVGWGLIWPLALVGVGMSMLFHALERRDLPDRVRPGASVSTSTADTLREWATFGGIKRRLNTQDFQGGEMIAVFGGIEVDLREANIPPGKEVVVDANATFGGIELRVPYSWEVVMRGMGIFGGYEDKTVPPRPTEGVTPPRLLVTGYAVFGGVSIGN
jgi:predicted membrane protein